MEKYFIAKSENYPNIVLDIKYEDYKRFYSAHAKNLQGEEMGFVNFNFGTHERTTWIWKIETQEQFQHQGVATALLSFFEHQAHSKRFFKIEGKYYPTNEFAKPFYKKMGYTIEKDGYEQYVDKYLSQDSTIQFEISQSPTYEKKPEM